MHFWKGFLPEEGHLLLWESYRNMARYSRKAVDPHHILCSPAS
ncbi:hypothetical protein EVA_05950 [gut metagenome]|uniref:Uncharacterized protein n=1 Tax=gut metagenome TaxID=749906 RepID=J9GTA2_9ZZZZ